MPRGWFRRLASLGAVGIMLLFGSVASAQQIQPGYSVIRVADGDGNATPYAVWVSWMPTIVTTPDGGAWVFFSAQPPSSTGAGKRGLLYAARFDPTTGSWQPARRLPGGEIQFGASAVVDREGQVHVVYSDRASADSTDYSTLTYTVSDGQGGWAEPIPIAPHEKAGHQLSPQITIDGDGAIHVIWQDQRNVTDEQRAANAAYADIFVSDQVDGRWSAPVQVSRRENAEINSSQPKLVADGDRLVAIWSIYEGVSNEALESAIRVEWSTRPLDPAAPWEVSRTLIERNGAKIGGKLVDLAPAPGGGVIALYGRLADQSMLFVRRLEAGQAEWGAETLIRVEQKGSYPVLGVASDGTVYVVYEGGYETAKGSEVDVGALAVAPNSATPGPDTLISPGEPGGQGRPGVAVDEQGRVWIVYFHQPENSLANEVRVLRGARIPTESS